MAIRYTSMVVAFSVGAPAEFTQIDATRIEDGTSGWCTQVGVSKGTWTIDKTSAQAIDGTTCVATSNAVGRWALAVAANTGNLLTVDTVLGVVTPTNNTAARTGDLATMHAGLIGATTVIASGGLTANDGGGGVFLWSSDTTTADDGGTIIVPNTGAWVRDGCWKRLFTGPIQVTWFGLVADDTADDAQAIENARDSLGDTTKMRSGIIQWPNEGTSLISRTILWDRKSCHVMGPNFGSLPDGAPVAPNGFAIRWGGVAGDPMFLVTRCQGITIDGLRFVGDPAAMPSFAIEARLAFGDNPPNSNMCFRNIWIGGGLQDPANPTGLTNGIGTTGFNAQNDQSSLDHVLVQNVTDACIWFGETQNTCWRVSNSWFNNAAIVLRNASRIVEMDNCFSSTITEAVVELTDDGSVMLKNCGAENCKRWCGSAAGPSVGSAFLAENCYFQSNSALMPGDNAIINVSTAGFSLILTNINFTRSGVFANGQEQIKVRGTIVTAELAPSVSWVDQTLISEKSHLDFATTNALDTRNIQWGKESYRNTWLHGDAVNTLSERSDFNGAIRVYNLTVAGGAPTITSGTGVPATVEPNGSIFMRIDGGAGTSLYYRQGGVWTAVP